jgi:hypothetical protein
LCPTVVAIFLESRRRSLDLSYVAESCCQESRAMSEDAPVLFFFGCLDWIRVGGSTMIDAVKGGSMPLLYIPGVAVTETGDGTNCIQRCNSNTASTVNRGKPRICDIPSACCGQHRESVCSISVFLPLRHIAEIRYDSYHDCRRW